MSSYSNSKRKVMEWDEEEELSKRRKSVEIDDSDDHTDSKPSEQTEFTDINTDCLEKIFNYLELDDLLNVADTCTHFKGAADIVASRIFAKKWIIIDKIRISRARLINIRNGYIELIDLKSILGTLRLFGHLIKKLKIKGNDLENFPEQTIEFIAKSVGLLSYYIGHYCTSSLTELTIEKAISFKLFKKPFLKVEKVKINIIHLPRSQIKRNWFVKLFPNVRQLTYKSVFGRISSFESIVDHFPKLEHLNIENLHCKNLNRIVSITDDECTANNTDVMKSLSLNPQLTTLALSYISDINILKLISEQQHQLECLSFQYAPKAGTNSDVVHFQSVKKLKIWLCSPSQRPNSQPIEVGTIGNEMCKIPFSFAKLEEFTIQTCYQYSSEFYSFIDQHGSIKKLNIRTCGWPQFNLTDLNRTKLVTSLPALRELSLTCHVLKNDEAMAFIKVFKQLEKFSFKLYLWDDKNIFKKWVHRLNKKWEMSVCSHGSYVKMNRTISN